MYMYMYVCVSLSCSVRGSDGTRSREKGHEEKRPAGRLVTWAESGVIPVMISGLEVYLKSNKGPSLHSMKAQTPSNSLTLLPGI